MSIKCPYCKEDYSISFEKKEIQSFITNNYGDIKNNPNSYSSIDLANKNG